MDKISHIKVKWFVQGHVVTLYQGWEQNKES